VFRLLAASLCDPVRHWPRDGAVWASKDTPSTLVLHQVASLPREDQDVLLAWLDDRGRDVQIISLSTRPLYPLVEAHAFLASLYYRLNSIVVDCRLAE
jgi:transcriptional regulator of acetoin/glycerol metabolism